MLCLGCCRKCQTQCPEERINMLVKKIRKAAKAILSPIFYFAHTRDVGTIMEYEFWDGWIKNEGVAGDDDFRKRLDDAAEVEGYHRQILDKVYQEDMKILDVGAGPVTAIYSCYNNSKLQIRACDPLGDGYKEILRKYNRVPRVVTETCVCEDLSSEIAEKFDWINCQNALDHASDPCKVLDEMISLLLPKGTISLFHAINEGVNEGFRGFHKWNIAPIVDSENSFSISSLTTNKSYISEYRGCKIITKVTGDAILCILTKSDVQNW